MVKLLGICGSPRKAATEYILTEALQAAAEIEGVTTQLLTLRGKKINFCLHCDRCVKNELDYCPTFDDDMRPVYQTFYEADAYLLASPVYNMGASGQIVTFLNRFRPTYTILKKDPNYFSRKVGGAIAIGGTRNGGQETALNVLLGFYYTHGILVVSGGLGIYHGAAIWSQDRKVEGAREDVTGVANARTIARRVAEAAIMLKSGKGLLNHETETIARR
ncbi:flavodoxin family protein [Moorella sp. Hama-1]|uniref:flavodoxin family protein n=1 Tax=Moorella sp. Hama-1 TaxID=2138101 RepID=UPI00137961F0|nr:flavodoxin family protein [Moorella sp. Hama-1]BCV21348.1 NAD(FAD)-dependent dehydrogenase [Moorella sp. Hama-1]